MQEKDPNDFQTKNRSGQQCYREKNKFSSAFGCREKQ